MTSGFTPGLVRFRAAPTPPTFDPAIANQLAKAKCPVTGNWAVYDGDTDQVKVHDPNGDIIATIGLAYGYENGPAVTDPDAVNFAANVKLSSDFWAETEVNAVPVTYPDPRTALTYDSEGMLWINDTATGRCFRLDPANSYDVDGDNWFMYLPKSYCTSVDPNSPNNEKRVFNLYLEFEVDHTETTFEDSWKLKYYWGHEDIDNGDPVERHFNQSGLFSVTTFSGNGRTYALTASPGQGAQFCMVELVTPNPTAMPPILGGLRYCTATELLSISASDKLETDGARLFITKAGSSATFNRRHLKAGDEFYSNGDPKYDTTLQTWGPITVAPADPIESNFQLTSDKIIVYHPDRSHVGFHLGALSKTSTPQWLWKTCTTGPLDGKGKFDPFASYAGWDFTVVGEYILCVYKGEFWKGQGQANQIFHYSTAGTFLRQFGMPKHAVGHEIMNTPGAALNMFTISAVKEDGTIYVYTNDEGGRGIHRWRLPE